MVVGIGGFRDIGDPNDPRRRRGPAPQGANIPGLPDAYYGQENLPGLFVGPSQLGSQTDRDIERYVARKAMQRAAATPETIPQQAPLQGVLNLPGSQGDVVNLGESLLAALNAPAPARSIVQGEPGYYRDDPVQRRITPVGESSSLLDRKVRRAAESKGFDPRNKDAASPIAVLEALANSDNPVDQELYNEYVRGAAAASDTFDAEENKNLKYGQFTAVDPTTGSLTAKQPFTPNPFGTVDIPVVQRTGQFAIPSGRDRGQIEVAKIDPSAIAYTEDADLDNPFTSAQSREVPIGTVQKEAKVAAETPTIFESALVKGAKTGRFRPLDTLNPVNYEKYLKKDGTAGTLVGLIKLDMTESQAMARFPKDSITVGKTGIYAPVYKVMQEDGTQKTTLLEVPDRNNRFSEVEIYPEKLYRIGNPFKGDSDKVRQQVAPYVGVRNVKVPAQGKKQVLSANRVRQAAAKGFEFFSGPEMEDRQLLQPEQVTGANKVFLRRPDGTTTQLTPQIVGGKLTGNYRIDDAYDSRQVGPASYVEGGARYGVERSDTQADIRNIFNRRVLGESAVKYKDVDADMIAGNAMDEPRTANAYRDILAPKLLSGEISIEQLEKAAPGLRQGTYARQLLEEAVQEIAGREVMKAERYGPRFLGYGDLSPVAAERAFTEKFGVDASDLAQREEIEVGEGLEMASDGRSGTFEDEEQLKAGGSSYDKRDNSGIRVYDRTQYEGVPDTQRERKLKAKVLEILQERMDDSAAQGVSPAMTNEGQAAYLADVIRRNVGEGGQVRLGNLLGGEVRTTQAPPPEQSKARGQESGEFLNAPRKEDAFLMAQRRKFGL